MTPLTITNLNHGLKNLSLANQVKPASLAPLPYPVTAFPVDLEISTVSVAKPVMAVTLLLPLLLLLLLPLPTDIILVILDIQDLLASPPISLNSKDLSLRPKDTDKGQVHQLRHQGQLSFQFLIRQDSQVFIQGTHLYLSNKDDLMLEDLHQATVAIIIRLHKTSRVNSAT